MDELNDLFLFRETQAVYSEPQVDCEEIFHLTLHSIIRDHPSVLGNEKVTPLDLTSGRTIFCDTV